MNTKTIVDKKQESIEVNKTYDEVNTEEGAIKKIWNALLDVIIFFDSIMWGQIHEELNEGIVGKKVASKDCYRIGFVEQLKEFAEKYNILFAKDGSKFYAYNGEYWISISEDLLKGFLHKAAKKMGIPDSLSSCVKFIKSTHELLRRMNLAT